MGVQVCEIGICCISEGDWNASGAFGRQRLSRAVNTTLRYARILSNGERAWRLAYRGPKD